MFANASEVQRQSLERLRALERAGAHLVFGHDATQVPDDDVRTL